MYNSNYISNSRPVAIPATSKYGFVRNHSTGEFAEEHSRIMNPISDRKYAEVTGSVKAKHQARQMARLCKADAKRRSARDGMVGW